MSFATNGLGPFAEDRLTARVLYLPFEPFFSSASIAKLLKICSRVVWVTEYSLMSNVP